MPASNRRVLSLILGGGKGTRLFPLTKLRAKPAVPVAGKYRLIDIPISNCINSDLHRIYVLTQFLSVSLHRHISNTYKFDMFSRGFVEILAAMQTYDSSDWYQGTADAVRQNILYVKNEHCDEVLILSGDQLYRMDYRSLIDTHRKSGADVTIAAIPVREDQTSRVRAAPDGRHRPGEPASPRSPRRPRPGSRTTPRPRGSRAGASRPTAGRTWPTWASTCSRRTSCWRCSTPRCWTSCTGR